MPSLAGLDLSCRYCAWRGGSDRRYIATVYPADRRLPGAGLPTFESFVLIAVGRGSGGRYILDVSAIERESEFQAALARGLAASVEEWHIHLLAEDRNGRAATVADLSARHGARGQSRCA